MKNYRMIFCDIDGTLLNSENKVSNQTKSKIQELDRAGVLFVLISARMPSGIFPILKELGIHAPIICYNGAFILDSNQDVIFHSGIEFKKAIAIKKFIAAEWENVCCSAYSGFQWIVDDKNNPCILQEQSITSSEPIEKQLMDDLVAKHDVHKFLCMGQPDVIDTVKNTLSVKYPELTVYCSKPTYLEIMNHDISKSNAIKLLSEKYNIPIESTASFGDNFNDIDMLRTTGISFAMGNAPDFVQQNATLITQDNDHDGVYAGLVQLGY